MNNDLIAKLKDIVSSNDFGIVKQSLIDSEMHQREFVSIDKFRRLLEDYDARLSWPSEYKKYIKEKWLLLCYRQDAQNNKILNTEKWDKDRYKFAHFHPYKLLHIFPCHANSQLTRGSLIIWLMEKMNNDSALKAAKEFNKSSKTIKLDLIHCITEIVIALEPIFLPEIKGTVTLRNIYDQDEFEKLANSNLEKLIKLFAALTQDDWRFIHDNINRISRYFDENSELKTLITLMRWDDQLKIKGKLGAALLIREMAWIVRRFCKSLNIELQEEQFSESPGYTPAYFEHLRGSKNIADGSIENKLKFLRGFGLDFGLRVRLYVEGDTEYGCFNRLLGNSGIIEIINLKGAFAQRNGKGIAFRESLINDRNHHIYSLIMLDKDVGNNVRVVKDSAMKREFMGQFYINEPDVEIENFKFKELCEIVASNYKIDIDSSSISDVKNGTDFVKFIRTNYPGINFVGKGEKWGEMLGLYSYDNPRTEQRGLIGDRKINQVLRFCQFAFKLNFANDIKDHEIDVATGLMIRKKK